MTSMNEKAKHTNEKTLAKMMISEEQAKILLEQTKMETENRLGASKSQGKRILIIGVVLLIAAIAVAVLSTVMLESMK